MKKILRRYMILLTVLLFTCLVGCDDLLSEEEVVTAVENSDENEKDTASQTKKKKKTKKSKKKNKSKTSKSDDSTKETDYGDYDGVFAEMKTTDLDGNKLRASVFSDYMISFVNVWNLSCGYCIEELPYLEQISEEYKDQYIGVFGLYYNYGQELSSDEKSQIQATLANAGADYTQIIMNKKMYATDSMQNVMCFPTTFVVRYDGVILGVLEGARDYDGWVEVVETCL